VRQLELGVALCRLPATFPSYLELLESSARRNRNKALRNGYLFAPIAFNDHLRDIAEIRRSADVRQGPVPDRLRTAEVRPCTDPPSRSPCHGYRYFGVLRDDRLVAYAGCLVAGELCMVEHVLGHAGHQPFGVVPLLLTDIAGAVLADHPRVRAYGYGTFFGAGPTMRRFKTKLAFTPHRVRWILGGDHEHRSER
jgi:hypothetical protein